MDANKFLADILEQFEGDVNDANLDVPFKSLETWDSLTAAAIQVKIEDDYQVKVEDKNIRELTTFRDLYNFVLENKK
jgi:acyl carrier protein